MPDNGLDFAERMRERQEPPEPAFDRLEDDSNAFYPQRRRFYSVSDTDGD